MLLDVPVIESNNIPKLKKLRSRSIDSTYFQIMLRRMVEVDAQTRIVEMNSSEEEVRVLLRQRNRNFHVLIGQEPTCDCQKQQMSSKKTCIHII